MNLKTLLLFSIVLFIGCKSKINTESKTAFDLIKIDTLFQDKISIRAILVDKDKVWYSADKNRFGFYDLKTNTKTERKITKDTLQLEFRSIAQTTEAIFVLSVANPALLYKINKTDLVPKLVYQENNEKVFYDSMKFWNDKDGIAIGDPTDNCFSLLLTTDGGTTWRKIPCDKLPKIADGEAFFAASNTNINVKDGKIFIVSGGKKSRLFVSEDKGMSWKTFETPIVQGEAMTGIFTADFFNQKIGFIAGGNYDKPLDNAANKALTIDGGKTWKLMAVNESFGYASCIKFVPNNKGNELVAVGTSGVFYTNTQGNSWDKVNNDKDLYTIRFLNENTAFAAGRNKMIRIDFKK
ncbi:MAG: oxidoreductase [Bacteroidota bacterium]